MDQPIPKYALVAGRLYVCTETVDPIAPDSTIAREDNSAPCGTAASDNLERIVLCRLGDNDKEAAERRYLPESLWRSAAKDFAIKAKESGTVTSQSPAHEKIALYRALFQGRCDVHAHGFRGKDGKIGYAPACTNEWKRGVCPRTQGRKVKCTVCENKSFAPIADATLIAHFKGADERFRDVIGLYVLNNNSKTHLLVLDFDKDGWKDAVGALRKAAAKHGLEAHVERSRSGNGGHAWFFFSEAIDAKLARDFGSTLIAEAMAMEPTLNFDAFDRMLPAQTTIPEGGFGNLIAAPFQGRAQREGNSVFIDETFVPYPDQWLHLSRVKKLDIESVRRVAYGAGDARREGNASGGQAMPWEPKVSTPLARQDFPERITVVEADMLYVSERGLSANAAFRIKRLAAFANPEFFKLQALHRSVYNTPRIMYLGEKRDDFIALPRGCKGALLAMLDELQVSYIVEDKRIEGARHDITFKGKLRPEQEQAIEHLAKFENGILSAPTGFGKTVIAAALIAQVGLPTLVIVPKTALLSQWSDKLEEFLAIEYPDGPALTTSGKPSKRKRHVIGQIGGGKNRVTGIVDIATFQSLVSKDSETAEPQAKEIVKEYGLVICDECHHAAAPQMELILKAVRAKFVYGLSATPKRADKLDRALFMLCGPIRCRIDPKDQARQQGFRRILRPRFTKIRLANYEDGQSFNQILDELCKHDARNRLIAADVAHAMETGRRALVLSKRKEHVRRLADIIAKETGIGAHVLVGEGTTRQRREKLAEAVSAVSDGPAVIVATESYLGEGFDASALDALFLATPISFDGNVTQQAGRLHRTSDGKTSVEIYDYVDASIPMLERMHKKRLKTYAGLGYEIAAGEDESDGAAKSAQFITHREAMRALTADIANATCTISIAAPYASSKTASSVIEALADAVRRGVYVDCRVAKRPESAILEQFAAAGMPLAVEPAMKHPCLAIFDGKTIWYGTIPLFAFAQIDDCSIRIESAEAAHDLLAEIGNKDD